jgi:tetratricopeptide (TPR) repeat protein
LLCGSITPVYSQTTEPESSQQKIANSETVIDEVKRSLQRLEDKERQNYDRELEGQRKNIDWLFSTLTVVIGIVAFMGVFAPFMMFQSNRKQMQGMLDEVKEVAEKIRLHEESAKQSAFNAQRHEKDAEISKEKISSYRSDQLTSEIENQEITKAAEQIQHDPQFDPKPGLRAAAIEASLKNQPEKAYKLWEALAELESSDIYALFNAGYWALYLADKLKGSESSEWLIRASDKYQKLVSIRPDFYEAVNNWGIALANQARELAKRDLPAARALWHEAAKKYQQALSINQDYHEAEFNWGNALIDEAKELGKINLHKEALDLWHKASEKYQQVLRLRPDDFEATYCCGVALTNEALGLAESNLPTARNLWHEAGDKYKRVLGMNPDYHKAADDWGFALLEEANAIAATDGDQANELRDRAEQLLLQHAKAAPEVVAYNLACVYGQRSDVPSCLHWLKTAQVPNKLVSCVHLQTDSDLDAVRDHPDFQAWLQSVCSH